MKIRITTAVMALTLVASTASAQETRSMIYGRVLDPQLSTVAGAVVRVTHTDTNTTVTLMTNDTGYYEAALLLPGNYQVSVEMTGFKKFVRAGITLPMSTRIQIDVTLELGSLAETVTVSSEAPLLETNAVSAGRVFDNRTMMDLPALGNNPMLLAIFTPGIQAGGVNKYNSLHTLGGASDFHVYGKVGENEFSIDGAPNTRGSGGPSFLPAADSLQEFKVETTRFDASIGHSAGAHIVMMTKSGTNTLHGTATEQHWQQRWNGTPFFVKQKYYREIAQAEAKGDTALANFLRSQDKQGAGRSNTYTATLGGPVYLPRILDGRNRLFFFFSLAGFRDKKRPEGDLNRTVPTLANRDGDFSRLLTVDAVRYQIYDPLSVRPDPGRPTHYIRDPIPGNIIPKSRFANPAYDAYVKLLPKPNNEVTDPRREPSNNYLADRMPFDWTYDQIINRVDYHHSNTHRFFWSWSKYNFLEDGYDWTYEVIRGLSANSPTANTPFDWRRLSGTVTWTYTPTATTIMDAMVALADFRTTQVFETPRKFKPSDVGLPAYLDAKAGDQTVLPTMYFDGYHAIGRQVPPITKIRPFTTKATVAHIRGRHSFRAGVDARQQFRTMTAGGFTSGRFRFSNLFTRRNDDTLTPAGDLGHSWAAFIMGIPSEVAVDTNDSYAIHSPYYGFFVQDDWRVTPRLSLNLGFRAEYEGGITERYNRAMAGFDVNAALPISGPAEAAYAMRPLPELAAGGFRVVGGSRYAGVGGAPRQINRSEVMWLPRLGLVYQVRQGTVVRFGVGTFFDSWNAMRFAPVQIGFSRTTSTNLTNDFGVTWLAGDPRNGVSPLRDPFPLRPDGTRFDVPVRERLGAMAVAGRNFAYDAFDSRRARQQRWRIGVQQQFGASMAMEIAYAGSYTDRAYVNRDLNALPERFWADGRVRNDAIASNLNSNVANPFQLTHFKALADSHPMVYGDMATRGFFTSPTIRKFQLLLPYPHLTGLTQTNAPVGAVRTHQLEISFERRFSRGFNLMAGYTRMSNWEADYYHNPFDPAPSWRESNDGRPHRFVASGIVEIPFGRGRRFLSGGPASLLVGGWQLAATYEWQPGPLVDWGNLFYYGALEEIRAGTRSLDRWFNTANFERNAARGPAAFHRRVFPTRVSGLRADMTNQWNSSLMREFRVRERVAFQVRLDTINTFNRSQFAAPDVNPYSTNFGRITAQTTATNRIVQLVGRLRF